MFMSSDIIWSIHYFTVHDRLSLIGIFDAPNILRSATSSIEKTYFSTWVYFFFFANISTWVLVGPIKKSDPDQSKIHAYSVGEFDNWFRSRWCHNRVAGICRDHTHHDSYSPDSNSGLLVGGRNTNNLTSTSPPKHYYWVLLQYLQQVIYLSKSNS
jgi:hypothetical protein